MNEYLLKGKGIDPTYNTFDELQQLQVRIQSEINEDFPRLSYDAFLYKHLDNKSRFFRIGSTDGVNGASILSEMVTNNVVSIGWYDLGDLEDISPLTKVGIKDALMAEGFYDNASTASRKAGEIFKFYNEIKPFDYVLVADGISIKAIGKIVSNNYFYEGTFSFPHCRNVTWIKTNIDDLFINEGLMTSVWQYEYPNSIEQIEVYLGIREPKGIPVPPVGPTPTPQPNLPEFPLNIILYGPPGTGKTYNTIDKSVEIINGTVGDHEQNKFAFDKLKSEGRIAFVTFHQNYTYEDFIVGLKPATEKEQLLFKKHEGIFYKIVEKAKKAYELGSNSNIQADRFVLIIDEINRANISKVFGELITLLEDDKRLGADNELSVTLSNGETFTLPPNLYIVGTMNTADKSISLIDIALRRRFEFIGMYPDSSVLNGQYSDRVTFLESINRKIYEKRKNADYLIGYAYFISNLSLEEIITKKVIPLVSEYFNGRIEEVESLFEETGYEVKYDTSKYKWFVSPKSISDAVA
ncbi:AAA family ATPase [Segetibacter koreensis]|uniref:AAA family ATPase n=1 Tax=Segetibacter koreensis TaxID=398037 RepID=UPI00146C43AF|nr:AAA family ATPase [Segetibacter koreensis]